jgi:MFS family permease
VLTGWAGSIAMLLACRLVLGVAEGVYWPQQSRFARGWFAHDELTKANSLIQYYGQFLALAIGFLVLTPLYDALGWRALFFMTGGIGLVLIVPLYAALLKRKKDAPFLATASPSQARQRLTLTALGGPPFLLLVFSYIAQGMLFWGVTLWIPLAVHSLGFTGTAQAIGSALPYVASVVLAIPMSYVSDRTGKRVLIAALGLLIPGVLLILLPQMESGVAKLGLITAALGFYTASYTPNIWSIVQASVAPEAVGSAAGIVNGLGAGGGGTLAGFLVGLLYRSTGSYIWGFVALGGLSVLGGLAVLAYGRAKGGVAEGVSALPT